MGTGHCVAQQFLEHTPRLYVSGYIFFSFDLRINFFLGVLFFRTGDPDDLLFRTGDPDDLLFRTGDPDDLLLTGDPDDLLLTGDPDDLLFLEFESKYSELLCLDEYKLLKKANKQKNINNVIQKVLHFEFVLFTNSYGIFIYIKLDKKRFNR